MTPHIWQHSYSFYAIPIPSASMKNLTYTSNSSRWDVKILLSGPISLSIASILKRDHERFFNASLMASSGGSS